jgi:hypothetical protein
MSWLTRLLHRGGPDADDEVVHVCRHLNLEPLWDDAADVGDQEKAIGYTCIACGATITLVDAQVMGRTPPA